MEKIPDYYERIENKALEKVRCWMYAMAVCVVLAAIWAILEKIGIL